MGPLCMLSLYRHESPSPPPAELRDSKCGLDSSTSSRHPQDKQLLCFVISFTLL